MKLNGLLTILIFFSSSIHAANCIPEVKDKKVTIEYFDGEGNIIRSETHKVRSKKKYKGLVSNKKAFKKLEKDKTGNIKIKSSKLDLKSGGMTTRVSTRDGTSLAKIGGCPVSKLKFYDRIGKEKSPFIHKSLIEAATKTEVLTTAVEKTTSSTTSNSSNGKESIGSTSAIAAVKPSKKVKAQDNITKASRKGSPEIAGKWSGFLHCFGVNLFFDMEIQATSANQLSAVFEAEPKVMERKGINWKPEKINTSMQGTYNPELAIFNLQSINAPNTQAFDLVGIVEPGDQKMSVYAKSKFYNTCSYAIASKKSLKKTIKSIVKQTKFTPKRYSSKGITRQQCDANIQEWVQQLTTFPGNVGRDLQKYAAIQLFQDQYFKPHFGKSFKKMSKSDMMETSFQLQSGCRQKIRTHKVSAVIPYLNTVFENNSTLSRGEVFMYPVAKEIVKTWAAWAKETIANISDDPNGELDLFLKDSKKVSSILWPNDTVDFEFEIAKAKQRSNTKLLLADIKDKIRSGDNGIQDLLALSKKSLAKKSSRRSVSTNTKVSAISAEGKKQASAMIAAEINQHAVPAVKSFASSQTTLNSMSKLQPVVSNQTLSPLNRYLSPEKKKAIDAILADRKDALTTELAAKENVIFQNYYSKGERDLKELASLVGYEGQLKKKYGALLSNNAFTNFNRDRQSLRQEILTVQENNIKAQINNTFDEKPIEALLTKHVHPKDRNTPKGKSLYAQKDTRFIELQALRDRNRIQDLNGMYLVSNDVIARIVQDKQGNRIAFKTLVEETSRKKLSKGALISKGVFDLKTQRLKTQGVAYPPVAGCGDIWNPTSLNEAVWSNKFLPLLAQDNQSDIKVWKQSESGGGPGKPCRIFETSISQCRVLRCLEWDDGKKNKLDKEANFIVKDLDRAKSIYAKLDKLADQLDGELRAAERKHLGGSQSNPWDDYWDQRIDNARDSALDW